MSLTGNWYAPIFCREETPTGVDGVQQSFSISKGPIPGSVVVYLNGVFQTPGIDYNRTGRTIVFIVAPPNGSALFVRYLA